MYWYHTKINKGFAETKEASSTLTGSNVFPATRQCLTTASEMVSLFNNNRKEFAFFPSFFGDFCSLLSLAKVGELLYLFSFVSFFFVCLFFLSSFCDTQINLGVGQTPK